LVLVGKIDREKHCQQKFLCWELDCFANALHCSPCNNRTGFSSIDKLLARFMPWASLSNLPKTATFARRMHCKMSGRRGLAIAMRAICNSFPRSEIRMRAAVVGDWSLNILWCWSLVLGILGRRLAVFTDYRLALTARLD
jgi:hypothetical protein